ncbi:MoaD/ThiS family protein [Thermoflexus hugenholtzii]|jgi:ThiS family.|uniref:ThiS family protein n=1 Tax=Thermoflexus hugenholtzii JAD2 TaxID=877466 RepID=A0A212PX92_9CHLR|nr:MoaD/ThiS family protein [Thermoflexus hugenholtzii]SNB51661.1 ThiS family protein [Thermoflexus hugenholtzii JAD2]
MIEVHLYGELRRYAGKTDPREEAVLRIPYREGLTVADLLREIGIDPEREVSNIFINGRYDYHARSRLLRDGDRLGVFPRNMGMLYC